MLKNKSRLFRILLFICIIAPLLSGQSRIKYNGRQIFLSGANVAWVNFAGDIGRGNTNIAAFRQMFSDLHQNGGNCMRLWLHTNGAVTPEFDSKGMVTGPGKYTLSDLRLILDEAQKNKISLMLCLWSFDMLRISYGKSITDRAMLMLTDTAYTKAYINNSLIPMINDIKGHPAILAWEIFNEPEGMSNEFGWDFNYHIPMLNIQRFINLTTGAIHRADSAALVTNGSWCFKAQSDIIASENSGNSLEKNNSAPTSDEKIRIEKTFKTKYGSDMPAEKIIEKYSPDAVTDMNYYRDDRLMSAGGDQKGILDFYTVHYYNWANVPLSPFHFPVAHWGLNKAIAIAEFFIEDTFGYTAAELYSNLIQNGYAGALAWAWYGSSSTQALVRASTTNLYRYFNEDVDLDPHSGKLLYFIASKSLIEKGDTCLLLWGASAGSKVFLDGAAVDLKGSIKVVPKVTTTYKILTTGEISDSGTVTITLQPSGKILSFSAYPPNVAYGEKTILSWTSSLGSSIKLNGAAVQANGEKEFTITDNNQFTLNASGDIKDSSKITVNVRLPEMINRCLFAKVIVSSSEKGANENPKNMVDGNLNTRWSSANADQQWFFVDLGRQHVINKFILRWSPYYAKKYRIGVSEDSLNWSIAAVSTTSTGGTEEIMNLNETGRYIKVMLDQRGTTFGFSLLEFEAFGRQIAATNVLENREYSITDYSLQQNYPNPFNPSTKIKFTVPVKGRVTLKIYDILGNEISVLINEDKNPGAYEADFKAKNLASGTYFCRLISGSYVRTVKMQLVK